VCVCVYVCVRVFMHVRVRVCVSMCVHAHVHVLYSGVINHMLHFIQYFDHMICHKQPGKSTTGANRHRCKQWAH